MINVDMKYFDVYYFCQVANTTIDSFAYIRTNNDFLEPLFEFGIEPKAFDKESILHQYCVWLIDRVIYEEIEDITVDILSEMERFSINDLSQYFANDSPNKNLLKHRVFWIEQVIHEYGIASLRFIDWFSQHKPDYSIDDSLLKDAIADYFSFLIEVGYYDQAVQAIANEIFYILFQNRDFLLRFNKTIAGYVQTYDITPSRVYIPKWVQRAVFFRDRGRCVLCNKDLSNTVDIIEDNQAHFDHIVSLDACGLNDVSNMQLLCRNCNLSKGESSHTGTNYRYWYDL